MLNKELVNSISVVDVARRLGFTPKRVGRNMFIHCIAHQEHTPSLNLAAPGNRFKCHGCGIHGNAVDFYLLATKGYIDTKDFYEGLKAVVDLLELDVTALTGETETPAVPKKASPDKLDKVYREWLGYLDLTPEHTEHLTTYRHMNEQEICIRLYKSMPTTPKERYDSVRKLSEKDLSGIPGFYQKQGKYGNYWTVSGRSGILIPFRDIYNRIVGLQIRLDKPIKQAVINPSRGYEERIVIETTEDQYMVKLDGDTVWVGVIGDKGKKIVNEDGEIVAEIKIELGPKYLWFSSEKYGGVGAGNPQPVHVAVPSNMLMKWDVGTKLNDVLPVEEVWLTEGPLKGDIASERLKRPFICVAGMSSWKAVIPYLKELKPEHIVLAFDSDAQSKDNIRQLVKECAKEIYTIREEINKDLHMSIGLWKEKDGKGVDDLTINGYRPRIERLF